MNGCIRKIWTAGVAAVGVFAVAGCCCKDCNYCSKEAWVDPCWPQRYCCTARGEVLAPIGAQANNGMILEQTLWNYHFVEGKDELNPMGLAQLDYIARRRPAPMPQIYLQTSRDLVYAANKSEQFAADRTNLDAARSKSITAYVSAIRPEVPFNVTVHDPGTVGMHSEEANRAVSQMHNKPVGAFFQYGPPPLSGEGKSSNQQQIAPGTTGAASGQANPNQSNSTYTPGAPIPGQGAPGRMP